MARQPFDLDDREVLEGAIRELREQKVELRTLCEFAEGIYKDAITAFDDLVMKPQFVEGGHSQIRHIEGLWKAPNSQLISAAADQMIIGVENVSEIERATFCKYVEEIRLRLYLTYITVKAVAGYHVQKNKQSVSVPIAGRLEELEKFAKRHNGVGVAKFAERLFPELSEIPQYDGQSLESGTAAPLPTTPPATWKGDKQPGETPPAFVKRVYGEWLGKGFTRATVRHLDPPLDQAITNWRRRHEWPADVDLPTKSEQTTRWVERVKQEGLASVIPDGSAQEVLRAARRLTMAKHRRNQEQQK